MGRIGRMREMDIAREEHESGLNEWYFIGSKALLGDTV